MSMDRILSVQSHVSFGYVGGKAAVFPLQLLGFDVDAVNTVNFSNHSGYGRLGGTRTSASELKSMFESMELNEVLTPARLLTGYIPGAEALSVVKDLATKLKSQNPDLIYVLDPVMGDSGRLYVAEDVIPVYREMLHLATIITPNYFEVETITSTPLSDLTSLRRALTILHTDYHVPNVVITSMPLAPWLYDVLPADLRPPDDDTEYLLSICSSSDNRVHAQYVPLLPGYFSGVGDLVSAMVVGHYSNSAKEGFFTPLSYAASQALSKTQAILTLTSEYASALPEAERQPTDDEADKVDPLRKTRRMRGRELRLVQGQDVLRSRDSPKIQMVHWAEFWTQ